MLSGKEAAPPEGYVSVVGVAGRSGGCGGGLGGLIGGDYPIA